ncbi:unnamed protein product, partial [Polarella glacialis]
KQPTVSGTSWLRAREIAEKQLRKKWRKQQQLLIVLLLGLVSLLLATDCGEHSRPSGFPHARHSVLLISHSLAYCSCCCLCSKRQQLQKPIGNTRNQGLAETTSH